MESSLRVLLFRIADHRCALAAGELREVVHVPELVRLAGLPAPVLGFFLLERRPVAVVDGGRLLGLPGVAETLYTPLIVLRTAPGALALMVDAVEGLATASVTAALGETESLNGCVLGIAETPDGPAQLLGAERVLLAAERDRIAGLEELALARLAALEGDTDAA